MQRHQLVVTTEKDKVHTFDTIEELSSYHNKVMNIHSANRRKAELREIVLANNFATFMSQAFKANELTVEDTLVTSLQATILELPNYLSPRELQQFIRPFLDCSAIFHAFVANADFMSHVAVNCSADLVDKMLALKIRTTSTNLGKIYHCRKTFQAIAAKFPEEHVARIMGYYMNGFTNWLYCEKRHVLAEEEQGKARAFDFFRNTLIPLLENFPIRYGRQVLQIVMDDKFLWQTSLQKQRSITNLLFTASKLAADIMPPLEVDHEKALSKDRFFTFALMYTLGEGTLACFSKDIIMHIISFCAPDFELQHGKQLLRACADQKASLQAMRKLSSGVAVLQSHATTDSRFTFFLSADQLARNYITLRDKASSDLPSFRESAAPYLKQFATLFKNPGKNAALANHISEMELYTDSAELLFIANNNQ